MQNNETPASYVDLDMSTTASYLALPQVNLSNTSAEISNDECKWGHFNTGILILLFFTLALNILASFVLFRVPLTTMRGRSNPVYFCIRVLNICDVLQAGFLLIMPAFATPDCEWIGGEKACSAMGFVALFFLLISPLITILMAFDRVIALYFPFKYRSQLGLKMLKILLPSSCAFVMLITMFPLLDIGEYHVVKGRRFCLLDTITDNTKDRNYVLAVHGIFLAALIFMLSCTAAIQWKLLSMPFSKKEKEGKSKVRIKAASRRTRNATLTAVAVCGIFVICYMPYVIRVLIEASTSKKSTTWITWLTFGLSFLQSLLNPVVCIVTNARYRKELKALIKNIKVTETEFSSESGAFPSFGLRTLSFTGVRKRLSSRSSRNSSRRSKPVEPHENNTVNGRPPASPRPYFLSTDGLDEQSRFLPECMKYATIGVTRTKNCDIKSMYMNSSSNTCPRDGYPRFELYSKGGVPSSSGSDESGSGNLSIQNGKATKM